MRRFLHLFFFFITLMVSAQNDQLAQNYFDKGEFEKALVLYQDLLKAQPGNGHYFTRVVESQQQLQKFDLAQKAIEDRLNQFKQAMLLVELGYNYQLQKNEVKARAYYEQAIDRIRKNVHEVYGVASTFERRVLIDYALQSYKLAKDLDPNMNFNYQMALLYGQKGNTDAMISSFLDEAATNPNSVLIIQNQLSRFMQDDADTAFHDTLRKALLVRAQKNQDLLWNQFLSWYFVQQKEYAKAFIQEKAIYRRAPETFANIVNLAQLAADENEQEIAREILQFVIENTKDLEVLIQAHHQMANIKVKTSSEQDQHLVEKYLDGLLAEFGIFPYTLKLQLLLANFLTFNLNNPAQAKLLLKQSLELQLNRHQIGQVKMQMADILLYEEKFNQALLYYSQIEDDLKNDVVGHEASFKAARTSYFKADFDYALAQFKALKSASTQLIANDALEYFLLISDNSADSTRTALSKFAKADYLAFKNMTRPALTAFTNLLRDHKGDDIEPAVLYRLGRLSEKMGLKTQAIEYYKQLLDLHPESIYRDEALYFSAMIFEGQGALDEAKSFYEKILFNHQDSIYFIESRKKFRLLRGDKAL
jgi:tetratricopeptide (TPR) repeat protein